MEKLIVNLDATPATPSHLQINPEDQITSQAKGEIEWDGEKVVFHLESEQVAGGCVQGYDLKKRLMGLPVLPAATVDFLLAHPETIPESWKTKKVILFWGTFFRDVDGRGMVRGIYWWSNERWCETWAFVSEGFDAGFGTAVLVD